MDEAGQPLTMSSDVESDESSPRSVALQDACLRPRPAYQPALACLRPLGLSSAVLVLLVLAVARWRLSEETAPRGPALQRALVLATGGAQLEQPAACEDAVLGDPCYDDVKWAMRYGVAEHPERYGGLTQASDFASFQGALHSMGVLHCAKPCTVSQGLVPAATPAVEGAGAPEDPGQALDAAEFAAAAAKVVRAIEAEEEKAEKKARREEHEAGAGAAGAAPGGEASGKHPEGAGADGLGDPVEVRAPPTEDGRTHRHSAEKAGQDASCKDAAEGDECYTAIIWALSHGVAEHPDWYEGSSLTPFSGFFDAQDALYKLDRGNCQRPCSLPSVSDTKHSGTQADGEADCADPKPFDRCYSAVLWARSLGIFEHPEWYKGVTPNSTFRTFQAALHKEGKKGCPAPCSEDARPKVKPRCKNLFCFSFMLPGTAEEELVKFQLDKEMGIFQCDDFRVISTRKVILGSLGGKSVGTLVNTQARTKDSWHNSELFASTWAFLIDHVESVFDHDWIVKADPDCVFFPDRLRHHLEEKGVPGELQYFTNCDIPAGTSKLYGALEAFTAQAIQAYSVAWRACQLANDWVQVGEDLYMQRCMKLLHVVKTGDFALVGDARCEQAPCTDASRAAFHPFKTLVEFRQCWQQASR